MSHLLELLGRGLDCDFGELLDRYFRSPHTQSISSLQDNCRQTPSSPQVHFQLGLAHLRSVQYVPAAEHLARACEQQGDHLGARVALATTHYETGRTDAALEQLKIAAELQPVQAPISFAIGFCLEKLSKPAEAAESYRAAIMKDPSFDGARERLAAVDLLSGDIAGAIAQYDAMRSARPEDGWVRSVLAHLYFLNRQYDQAGEEFRSAIAREPENWALVDDEVEVLISEGQMAEAIDHLHELIERQGSFADLHVRLADVHSMRGDDDAARTHYLTALEIQPTYLEARIKLGTHHLVFGRWEEAAEAFCRASELSDKVLVNYIGMAVACDAAGKKEAAQEALDLAGAIEPNGTLLLGEMARLQLKATLAERFADAMEDGQVSRMACLGLDEDELLHRQISRHAQLVERHRLDAMLRFRYAVLLRTDGKDRRAIEQFCKTVEICPTHVRAIIRLGLLLREHGLGGQAMDTLRGAMEVSAGQVETHYRLGILYTDRQRLDEEIRRREQDADTSDVRQIRADLASSLQNMGLMDSAAATWRSLQRMHSARAV